MNLLRRLRDVEAEWAVSTPLALMFESPSTVRPRERPAVFIDVACVVDTDGAALVPGAAGALRRLRDSGYLLVVLSDEPGLASGRTTRHEVAARRRAVERALRAAAVGTPDGWYTCPHAPGADGAPRCLCRRPGAGLLRQARSAHDIDLAASWVIGGLLDDVEAGRRAGCRTVLLELGRERAWRRSPLREPDGHCGSLDEAAALVVDKVTQVAAAGRPEKVAASPADDGRHGPIGVRSWPFPPGASIAHGVRAAPGGNSQRALRGAFHDSPNQT